MPNPKIRSQQQIVVGPDTDAFHFVDIKGTIVGWIDGTGTLQGNLVTTTGGNTTNLQGGPVSPIPPAPNQILVWNGSTWIPQLLPPPPPPNNLQGNPVSPVPPKINQVLGWDGQQWTPVTVSSPVNFADNEDLSSAIDGVNTVFILANAPNPPSSLHVIYKAGRQGVDQYTLQNNLLMLNFVPQIGDTLVVDYRY